MWSKRQGHGRMRWFEGAWSRGAGEAARGEAWPRPRPRCGVAPGQFRFLFPFSVQRNQGGRSEEESVYPSRPPCDRKPSNRAAHGAQHGMTHKIGSLFHAIIKVRNSFCATEKVW
jgi:hypothetical protein